MSTLNERKIKILEAIISDYVTHGEPVSSRTIAKRYDLGVSSATIRNEMSDLEELGLILQPHTSSGRVPTDLGYRMHVDRMVLRDLSAEQKEYLQGMIANNINHMEYLMKETAKAISLLTNYTTVVSEVGGKQLTLQHVQLMPLDDNAVVVTVITVTKLIKNGVVNTNHPPPLETLNQLTLFLNQLLAGKTADDIRQIAIDQLPIAETDKHFIQQVLVTVMDIFTLEQDIQVYSSGVNNMLSHPEFNDMEKAKGIFKTFEQKEMLITLLDKTSSPGLAIEDMQVVIGSENSLEEMKDCSIIRATYQQGDTPLGAIGIIGPTRMDYATVASVLNSVVKNINAVLYGIKK